MSDHVLADREVNTRYFPFGCTLLPGGRAGTRAMFLSDSAENLSPYGVVHDAVHHGVLGAPFGADGEVFALGALLYQTPTEGMDVGAAADQMMNFGGMVGWALVGQDPHRYINDDACPTLCPGENTMEPFVRPCIVPEVERQITHAVQGVMRYVTRTAGREAHFRDLCHAGYRAARTLFGGGSDDPAVRAQFGAEFYRAQRVVSAQQYAVRDRRQTKERFWVRVRTQPGSMASVAVIGYAPVDEFGKPTLCVMDAILDETMCIPACDADVAACAVA